MAETKSSKPSATSVSTKANPPATAKRSTTTKTKVTPEKSVPAYPRGDKAGDKGSTRFNLDPDHVGRLLHNRTTWIDEVLAIVFIVLGVVTLLSLLNTSSSAAISIMWSNFIRQLFGFVGTILISFMIIAVGVLIFLPHIGVHVRMPWQRIVTVEVAFLAFLSLLHVLAQSPEPRALARSGLGGGYIGWAISEVVVKLFGSGIAILVFGGITVVASAIAIGVRRHHVRHGVKTSHQRLNRFAEDMRKPRPPKQPTPPSPLVMAILELPQRVADYRRDRAQAAKAAPRPVKKPSGPMVRPRNPATAQAGGQTAVPYSAPVASAPPPPSDPNLVAAARRNSGPHLIPTYSPDVVEDLPAPEALPEIPTGPAVRSRPAAQAVPSVAVTPEAPPVVTPKAAPPPVRQTPPMRQAPAVRAELAVSPPVEEFTAPPAVTPEPAPASTAPATPAPPRKSTSVKAVVPPPPPRVTRHFTVDDFKETRKSFPRSPICPPMDLLNDIELNKPSEQEINTNAQIIEHTLLEFDIDVEVVDVKVGPTVTQYAVQPFREVTNDQGQVVMQRVRVNKISSLSSDLALALSAKRLRIQPYVPGRSYMGIEVPNRTPSVVALRPVMESENFAKAFIKKDSEEPDQTRECPLSVPLGRDVSGAAVVMDLATMPHLLIAGTTGSGKSVCIGAIGLSLVMNNPPDRVKLVLLDPKMVELNRFNGLPHLLGPVETDMERIIGVLRWATREMDRRYKLLEVESARNIEVYNKTLGEARKSEHLPYIVFMIDEIGDLMLSRPDEMERTLTRLAQMARAVGMHLVVATQRPSVDIITGLIKANFPARISFAVASGIDSRVILDNTGAETLMGKGDMLYQAPDAAGPQRVQGCFVSDPELEGVVNYWKEWATKQEIMPGADTAPPWERGMTRREALAETDPMLEDAMDLVIREGEASASQVQRQLGIPYPRAAHLIDLLAELGIVGKIKEGTRSREVLIKPGTSAYKKLMEKRKRA